jgi:hypothetical protein
MRASWQVSTTSSGWPVRHQQGRAETRQAPRVCLPPVECNAVRPHLVRSLLPSGPGPQQLAGGLWTVDR